MAWAEAGAGLWARRRSGSRIPRHPRGGVSRGFCPEPLEEEGEAHIRSSRMGLMGWREPGRNTVKYLETRSKQLLATPDATPDRYRHCLRHLAPPPRARPALRHSSALPSGAGPHTSAPNREHRHRPPPARCAELSCGPPPGRPGPAQLGSWFCSLQRRPPLRWRTGMRRRSSCCARCTTPCGSARASRPAAGAGAPGRRRAPCARPCRPWCWVSSFGACVPPYRGSFSASTSGRWLRG